MHVYLQRMYMNETHLPFDGKELHETLQSFKSRITLNLLVTYMMAIPCTYRGFSTSVHFDETLKSVIWKIFLFQVLTSPPYTLAILIDQQRSVMIHTHLC